MAAVASSPPLQIRHLLSLITLLLFSSSFDRLLVGASVHDYATAKFVPRGNAFVLNGGNEGLFASSAPPPDSSQPQPDAADDSFIRFEKITFRRPKESIKEDGKKFIQAIIFAVDDRETIGGSPYGGQRAICCTPDLANLGGCEQGKIIHRPSTHNPEWPQVLTAEFKGNDLVTALPSQTIQIPRTGMYNLYFMFCDPSLGDVTVEGKTIWKNPDGYLPGRMSPLLRFYGAISIAFLLLGVFWFLQYARFWKEVLQLQNSITLVIALGMLETTLWYFDYAEFNETGVRPMGITVWAVTTGVVRRTVSRVIILVVSMGFGVVRPTLGGLTSKVIMLGGTFFVASEVLELVENVGTVSDLSGKAILFLGIPVALLDAFFVVWIFTSLSKTLDKLQAKRMTAKLEIYRKFTNALCVAVIVSVCWIAYEIYFKSTDVYNERWQSAWIIPAFWHVLSFSLLCVICALWGPSQNSTRYAYSDDGSEDFDREEDTVSLIKPAPLQSKENWSVSSPDGKTALTIDPVADEEGKRE
ncbi:lung seven transmembrane receptor family protein [Wolffia australiana]